MRDARIGTVDKLQGQEAPVLFFSMTSSTGDDVPRGLDFLFSKNRLNVAVSRAQALAVVVCSPALLHSRCRTVGDMQLINMLCRSADMAVAA
jgi:superfamily I DNA and/or RNA helicase